LNIIIEIAKAVLLYQFTLDTMDKKNPYWMYAWKMSADMYDSDRAGKTNT